MIRIIFTDEEIAVLKREKMYNPFPMNRRKCEVLYLKAQGYKNTEIERIVGLTHSTITKYLKLYQHGGFDALTTSNYKG
jgi:transposase